MSNPGIWARQWQERVDWMRQNLVSKAEWGQAGDLLSCELAPLPEPTPADEGEKEPDVIQERVGRVIPGASHWTKVKPNAE